MISVLYNYNAENIIEYVNHFLSHFIFLLLLSVTFYGIYFFFSHPLSHFVASHFSLSLSLYFFLILSSSLSLSLFPLCFSLSRSLFLSFSLSLSLFLPLCFSLSFSLSHSPSLYLFFAEHRIALELKERELIEKIFPVFVGE